MIRTLKHPVFLLCLLLAVTNQFLEKAFGVFVPVVHSYLDDLLCMPIVLSLGLAAYRIAIPSYLLKPIHMISVLVLYSVYFEYHLPQVSSTATSDAWDILMYIIGLTVFSYFINRADDVGLESNQ